MVIASAGLTEMLRDCVATLELESVTATRKPDPPAAFGVPEITPPALSAAHEGSAEPELMLHV